LHPMPKPQSGAVPPEVNATIKITLYIPEVPPQSCPRKEENSGKG
jgi:hypothetical protein